MAKFFQIPEIPDLRFPWFGRMSFELWHPLRQYVFKRDNGICQYCGSKTELHECNIHHALALSEFGSNHPTNLKTSCKNCHKEKHPFMKDVKERYL